MTLTSSPARGRARRWRLFLLASLAAPLLLSIHGCGADKATEKKAEAAAAVTPALTVQVATAEMAEWPQTIEVSGPIAAWQEAIIGSEISGQRLVELRVNVGDRVKKGEVLARYNSDTLRAEQAELQAAWQQAQDDAARAAALRGKGALSPQQIDNYLHQAAIAKARLEAKQLQVRYATIVAPQDGIISARSATLGAVGTAGGELFRLILNGRLEWRGELSAEQLARVEVGQSVELALPDHSTAQATVRQLSPSLDAQSRLATVYADIAPGSSAHAGMYVSGTISMQQRPALVVPAVAVVIRDGRSYVFRVGAALPGGGQSREALHKVVQQPVTTGRHHGSDVEIVDGLASGDRVVLQGAGFLNEGDVVRVVANASAQANASAKANVSAKAEADARP